MDVVYQPNQELKKKLAEQQNEPAKRRRAVQTNEAQAAPEAPKKKEGCYIATARMTRRKCGHCGASATKR